MIFLAFDPRRTPATIPLPNFPSTRATQLRIFRAARCSTSLNARGPTVSGAGGSSGVDTDAPADRTAAADWPRFDSTAAVSPHFNFGWQFEHRQFVASFLSPK